MINGFIKSRNLCAVLMTTESVCKSPLLLSINGRALTLASMENQGQSVFKGLDYHDVAHSFSLG